MYSDVKGADYGVMRQLVVGTEQPDEVLRIMLQGLTVPGDVVQNMLEFLHLRGSLVQSAGASPALTRLLQDMNEGTGFVMEGSDTVTKTSRGSQARRGHN